MLASSQLPHLQLGLKSKPTAAISSFREGFSLTGKLRHFSSRLGPGKKRSQRTQTIVLAYRGGFVELLGVIPVTSSSLFDNNETEFWCICLTKIAIWKIVCFVSVYNNHGLSQNWLTMIVANNAAMSWLSLIFLLCWVEKMYFEGFFDFSKYFCSKNHAFSKAVIIAEYSLYWNSKEEKGCLYNF